MPDTYQRIIVTLDLHRRVTVYFPDGGFYQERQIPGIGWTIADEEGWSLSEVKQLLDFASGRVARML